MDMRVRRLRQGDRIALGDVARSQDEAGVGVTVGEAHEALVEMAPSPPDGDYLDE